MGATSQLGPAEYARLAVDLASDKLGSDVVLLDLRGVSDFTDYFVIVTAESARQLNNLTTEISEELEANGAVQHHVEGTAQGGWMLLDFGDVVIHLFGRREREYYQLEDVWTKGVETVRIQ